MTQVTCSQTCLKINKISEPNYHQTFHLLAHLHQLHWIPHLPAQFRSSQSMTRPSTVPQSEPTFLVPAVDQLLKFWANLFQSKYAGRSRFRFRNQNHSGVVPVWKLSLCDHLFFWSPVRAILKMLSQPSFFRVQMRYSSVIFSSSLLTFTSHVFTPPPHTDGKDCFIHIKPSHSLTIGTAMGGQFGVKCLARGHLDMQTIDSTTEPQFFFNAWIFDISGGLVQS